MPGESSGDWGTVADRMLLWGIGAGPVRALWIEGASAREVRRPYASLELHVAADEPEFAALVDLLPDVVDGLFGATLLSAGDAVRLARELRFRMPDGEEWTLIVERTSMLAKRPRAYVTALLDRTHHLTHVMDFSLRSGRDRRGAEG